LSSIDTSGVWIIVPAFNEGQVIGDVVADLRSAFAHVVVVDDGSRDDTGDAALRAGAHVVPHPVNLGQGAAIQTGVEYARRQPGAATFDADGQHRVKDLLNIIDRLCADSDRGPDLVVGCTQRATGVRPASRRRRSPRASRFSTVSTSCSTGCCEGGCGNELDPAAADRVGPCAVGVPAALAQQRTVESGGVGYAQLARAVALQNARVPEQR
jgi:hypothetical protein